MLRPDDDLLAPGRGQYDRLLPRPERDEQQRRRLLRASARACSGAATPTVQRIAKLAGVSRNTFYLHFAKLDQALAAASELAGNELSLALLRRIEAERTPVARWRALVQSCVEWLASEQEWSHVVRFEPTLLDPSAPAPLLPRAPTSALRRALTRAIGACLEATWRDMRHQGNVHSVRLTIAAVALEELTLRTPLGELTPEVEDEMVAVLVRLFH